MPVLPGLRRPIDEVACSGGSRLPSTKPFVRGSKRSDSNINPGTKVRIKQSESLERRPHLAQHARQNDVGVISTPSKQSPKMANLYVIVRFEVCGHDHRLLEDELLEA